MNIRAYIQRYGHDVLIAIEAILANRIKSLLTALGIIFGVAAVISMLAIGNGAQQEILEQIRMVGVNNIIVSPIAIDSSKSGFSRGLTLLDAESIQDVIPSVSSVCPILILNNRALYQEVSEQVKLEGTSNEYFKLFNIEFSQGDRFSQNQEEAGRPVCIIGHNVKNIFFKDENPMGKYIKCGEVWLKIVGVIEQRNFSGSNSEDLSISSTDNKIFTPIKTLLLRYENSKQLDQIVVQVDETEHLTSTAQTLSKLLNRRHNQVKDVSISIPEMLLKQQQRTKNIFNVVLGAIAGISLIVGGIGIMNIMLASVLERIREIGTRQAIGASKKDIVIQFLSESTLISLSGGLVGIILGIMLSKIISSMFDIKTIVSPLSILMAFGVSVVTGIVFGYLPAKRAAEKDPVESLRQ